MIFSKISQRQFKSENEKLLVYLTKEIQFDTYYTLSIYDKLTETKVLVNETFLLRRDAIKYLNQYINNNNK